MKKFISILALGAIMTSCVCNKPSDITVVPYPNKVQLKCGTFEAAGAPFHYQADLDDRSEAVIKGFASQLSLATGKESAVQEGKSCKGFVFILDEDMQPEAYAINVCPRRVKVTASGLNGFNYAVQTLKQMLPAEIFGKTEAADKDWSLPCVKINDAPRFAYRGMHMDVSRHFFDMDAVKRYLDIMEVHKLNTLHWHLTDDQGWRIEIKKYPRLTEVGSIRKETLIGHAYGAGKFDGTPYGEGCWFSQDQIREIIEYAASKGITIVPEIDLPGHMLAALAAYPQYGCTGGPYDVWGMWGIADDVLCAGNEDTMLFLEDILSEVADLFPSEYFHIGGDECPKVRWEKCPKCQAKIKELGIKGDDEFQAEHYLQSYVMKRMSEFLETKGKKIIGWDEILEGAVADNAVIMSWRGTGGGYKAIQLGHDVIMTPNTYYYLDYYQSLDKENEPLAIGGYLPIEKCYSFEPCTAEMTAEDRARILGVQANLWTEYIATEDHLHYMLLPRIAALCEVQWCQPQTKNWERFLDSADEFCNIYKTMGCNYATHLFDARGKVSVNNGCVEVQLEASGNYPVRYTLDGSEPGPDSPVYTDPIQIKESCTLKAKSDFEGKIPRIYEKRFEHHKAMGRPVKVLTDLHPRYTFNIPDMLTDGLRGSGPYNSGDFAGWYAQPMEVIIEMDGNSYNSVTLGAFVFKGDYIFGPTYLCISTSEDGNEFSEVARQEYPTEKGYNEGNGCRDYTVNFPETSAKYLKVKAGCLEALPEWHSGKGRPGFVFVDEVIVR